MSASPTPEKIYLRPRSLSPTALHVARLCKSRYYAENIERSKGFGGGAAGLGTACHGALEMYVVSTQVEGHKENATLEYLLDMFKVSYCATFGVAVAEGEAYNDGVEMLTSWFKRTSFDNVKVLSVESKTSFDLEDKKHNVTIPFNYIFDRLDQIGPDEDKVYRVVDYKTNRWNMRPDDLDHKVQARVYALVAQMMFPDAKRIWVTFDLLRHDSIGRVFSREQNINTWRMIQAEYRDLLETPVDEVYETLNPECGFCVKKTTCNAYMTNVSTGGIFSFGDMTEVVDRRAQLEWQSKAITKAIDELDAQILLHGLTTDTTEFISEANRVHFKVSNRRNIAPEMVEMVIGKELFDVYGGKKLTMGQYDKLMKDPRVSDPMRTQLKSLVTRVSGEPSVAVESRSGFDDD